MLPIQNRVGPRPVKPAPPSRGGPAPGFLDRHGRRLAMVGVVSLVAGLTVVSVRYLRANAQLNKVKDLQEELFSEGARERPPEEQREKFRELRQAFENLTPEQRQALGQERQKRAAERLNDFFKLSSEERTARLDEDIDRQEAMRKRFEAERARRQQAQQANGGGGGGGNPNAANNANNNNNNNNNSQRRRGGGGGGDGGVPGARDKAARQRLDNSSAQQRAQMAEYRRLMDERRKQRGLPPSGRPR